MPTEQFCLVPEHCGYITIAANEITTNQGFKSVVPNENVGTSFMYYLLKFCADHRGWLQVQLLRKYQVRYKSAYIVIPDNETIEKVQCFCTQFPTARSATSRKTTTF